MGVVASGIALVAVEGEGAGGADVSQIFGDVVIGGIAEACGVLVVVVVVGDVLDVGVDLGFVTDDLDVAQLALALLSVEYEEAVLEQGACGEPERGVARLLYRNR